MKPRVVVVVVATKARRRKKDRMLGLEGREGGGLWVGWVVVGGGKGSCGRQGMEEGEEAVKAIKRRELLRVLPVCCCLCKEEQTRAVYPALLMLPSLLPA